MSEEIVSFSKEGAEAELVSVNSAISRIYALLGDTSNMGVVEMTVGSREFSRKYTFETKEDLTKALQTLQERAAYLRNYIATFTVTSSSIPKFNQFSNIPMIFRKNL